MLIWPMCIKGNFYPFLKNKKTPKTEWKYKTASKFNIETASTVKRLPKKNILQSLLFKYLKYNYSLITR